MVNKCTQDASYQPQNEQESGGHDRQLRKEKENIQQENIKKKTLTEIIKEKERQDNLTMNIHRKYEENDKNKRKVKTSQVYASIGVGKAQSQVKITNPNGSWQAISPPPRSIQRTQITVQVGLYQIKSSIPREEKKREENYAFFIN